MTEVTKNAIEMQTAKTPPQRKNEEDYKQNKPKYDNQSALSWI